MTQIYPSAVNGGNTKGKSIIPSTSVKPPRKERTPEETEALKRQLFLNINSYHVGSYKEAKLDKLHNHVFQGDGDYIVVNNKIGNFIVKMNDVKRPGLPEELKGNKIQLKVPKIPGKIYHQIIAFFRDICDTMNNAEAFVQVYYDREKLEYVCHVPEQTVSGTSVRYDATANLNEQDRNRYTFVFEVHSHNTMGAYWSGTDDADEKETRFYGVFGQIKNPQIAEKFRFHVMDKEVAVKKEHIFDFTNDTASKEELLNYLAEQDDDDIDTLSLLSALSSTVDTYPAEWKENVKTQTYTYQGNTYGGNGVKKTYGGYEGGYGPYNGYGNGYDDGGEDTWHHHGCGGDYKKKNNKPEDANMTGYNNDGIDEIDISETFDIMTYMEEDHQEIMETFAGSLTSMHVPVFLEALIDHGFEYIIKEYIR